jgi:hypothetical protein
MHEETTAAQPCSGDGPASKFIVPGAADRVGPQPVPDVRFAWPSAAALALLVLEADSLAFASQELFQSRWLPAFISRNVLDLPTRVRLLASLGVVAVAAASVTMLYVWAGRANGARARVEKWARLAAPLPLLWALPPLTNGAAYNNRPLDLLLAAAAIVTSTELSARSSLRALGEFHSGEAAHEHRFMRRLTDGAAVLLAVGYSVVASILSIRLHRKLLTSNFDLGLFENLFFNTVHGVHGMAMGHPYFSAHAEIVLYPLLPLYALVPRPETLLVLQSIFIGGASLPLYLVARRWLRSPLQALTLILAYLLYPAVHGPNFYDFHFLALSVFFILWGAFFLATRRTWQFWAAVALALCCREDVALGLAAIGVGLVTIRRYSGRA